MPWQNCPTIDTKKANRSYRILSALTVGLSLAVLWLGHSLSLSPALTIVFVGATVLAGYVLLIYLDEKYPGLMYLKKTDSAEK